MTEAERARIRRTRNLSNGLCRCGRDRWRKKFCKVCWINSCWNNLRSRSRNRGGVYPQYSHVELQMTAHDFRKWLAMNPVPDGMENPTIDRMDSKGPYSTTNIRWLEHLENSRRPHPFDPVYKRCPLCGFEKPRTKQFYYFTKGKIVPYCRPCYNKMSMEKYRKRKAHVLNQM